MVDPKTTTRPHVRVEEFAECYGVSRRTVYNWIKWNWLPAERTNGSLRIPTDVIRRLERGDLKLVKVLARIA